MSLPRSTYYRRHDAAGVEARARNEAQLRGQIEDILAEFPAYGYRRVTHELRRRGRVVNHKRVARVMRQAALTPKRVRRFLATTDSDHPEPIYPNLLPQLAATGPDQIWVADLTYIRLATRFVFLAVILDAWSRKVVGYAISHLLDTRICLAALEAAIEERAPPPGLVHHSDRGVQYAARAYRRVLEEHGMRGSMARAGNPYDNAQVESFFKTLKHEEIFAYDYQTMDDVMRRLPYFLEEIYNRRRLHSALGYLPPHEYETLNAQSAA
jgi:putative transposase